MNLTRTSAVAIACAAAAAGIAGAALMRDDATPAPAEASSVTQTSPARDAARASIDVRGTVWVANEAGDSLTAIDAATGRVINAVGGIAAPHNVQASDDGRSVWAVSGRDSTLVGIGADSQRLSGSAATGEHPAHVVLDRAGSRAYVSNSGDDTVTAYDLRTMRRLATVPTGSFPHGMRISPDGSSLLVANMQGGSVTLVDLRQLRPTATIPVGEAPVQVAFDRAGAAYVSLNADDAVAKIDLATRRVVATRPTGVGPAQTYVTADGARLLVANQGTEQQPSDTMSVFDTRTMQLLATVTTGSGAHGIAVDPSSRYAFVTNMYDDDVAVVDLDELTVVSRIEVGDMPNGISFSTTVLGPDARDDVTVRAVPAPPKAADADEHGHDGADAH